MRSADTFFRAGGSDPSVAHYRRIYTHGANAGPYIQCNVCTRCNQRTAIELHTYISISELAPLVHPWPLRAPTWESPYFITCRTLPMFQRFFVFSISLGTFGCFSPFASFVPCACVYSELGTAGEPGAVAGVSGCWRVEGGVARNAVAVFVVRRRACLEIRGKHEWALSGLHLQNPIR